MHSSLSSDRIEFDCRRYELNRRQTPTRPLHVQGIRGRRKILRRNEDVHSQTDWFESHVMILALGIVLLCIADFIFTSIIMQHGGIELNLLMNEAISRGIDAFFIYKYLLTCLSLILLVAHQNHRFFRVVKVKYILYGFAAGYLGLMAYEIHLLLQIF